MPANVDAMIRAAVEAIRAGKKQDARTLLERAVDLDEYNENAWLWLSAVVDTPEEQRTCLDNVLIINPNNEKAKAGLKALGFSPSPPLPTTSSAAPFTDSVLPSTPAFTVGTNDLFGDVDFSAPGGRSSTPPPPTSSRDIIATSSASASFQSAVDDVDYDAWMDRLNIGTSSSSTIPSTPSAFDSATSVFGSDITFGDDDEFFNKPPVASTTSVPPVYDAPPASSPFGSEPFNDNTFGDNPFGTPAIAVDNDIFGETSSNFDDLLATVKDTDIDSLFGGVSAPNPEDMSIEELFARIPSTIKEGLLPGLDERYSPAALAMLGVGLLCSVAGLGLIVSKLAG